MNKEDKAKLAAQTKVITRSVGDNRMRRRFNLIQAYRQPTTRRQFHMDKELARMAIVNKLYAK